MYVYWAFGLSRALKYMRRMMKAQAHRAGRKSVFTSHSTTVIIHIIPKSLATSINRLISIIHYSFPQKRLNEILLCIKQAYKPFFKRFA